MINIIVKATNFLNALECIPRQIEQYKTENTKLEKDWPPLREIVGGTWKKKEELKQLKYEVAVLEREIQLTLTLPEKQAKILDGGDKFQENILLGCLWDSI